MRTWGVLDDMSAMEAFFTALRDADEILADVQAEHPEARGLVFILHEKGCVNGVDPERCNCVPRTARYEPDG